MGVEAARLIVRDWNGDLKHERHLEHPNPAMQMDVPASGFEAGRDGWGNCLELTFQAVWSTLQASERDILELDVLDGGIQTREFAGVLVKSGNSQVWTHTNFKAVGLKKRLQDVRTWLLNLPEQDAGLSVRQVIQAAVESPDLGQAIIYDPALIPDMAVPVAAFAIRGRKISDVLDYLAAQAGAVWGVNAERKVFLVKTANPATLTLTEGVDAAPTFEDTDSEALVTQVVFTLGQRPDGTLIQTPVTIPEAAQLGVAAKDVTLGETVPVWETVGVGAPVLENLTAQYAGQGHLSDGLGFETQADGSPGGTPVIYSLINSEAAGSVEYPAPAHLRVQIDLLFVLPGAGQGHIRVQTASGQNQSYVDFVDGFFRDPYGQGVFRTVYMPGDALLNRTLYYRVRVPPGQILQVYEFRPERPSPTILNRLTEFHTVLPNRDPATITASGRVTPKPTLSLVREDGSTYRNTVESLKLYVKLGVPLQTVIQAGQREAAEDRAARWLGQLAILDAAQDVLRFGRGT